VFRSKFVMQEPLPDRQTHLLAGESHNLGFLLFSRRGSAVLALGNRLGKNAPAGVFLKITLVGQDFLIFPLKSVK
jgi:hypothetical protein